LNNDEIFYVSLSDLQEKENMVVHIVGKVLGMQTIYEFIFGSTQTKNQFRVTCVTLNVAKKVLYVIICKNVIISYSRKEKNGKMNHIQIMEL
jgi:hypothetical protein